MSIEALLERIAIATEATHELLRLYGLPAVSANMAPNAPVAPQVHVMVPPASEPRKRGRPPKTETPVAPPPADTGIDFGDAPANDDFLSESPPPAKEVTKIDVRDALVALQKRSGNPEKARALLKQVGGVDSLGSLDAGKFAAVIEAANQA